MRMTGLHLLNKPTRHVVEVEGVALFCNYGVEEDLEQKIAQLLSQLDVVPGLEGLVDLVRFLDQIGSKGLMGLRCIPVATGAKIPHESERIFKRGFHLHSLQGSGILPALQIMRQCTV